MDLQIIDEEIDGIAIYVFKNVIEKDEEEVKAIIRREELALA